MAINNNIEALILYDPSYKNTMSDYLNLIESIFSTNGYFIHIGLYCKKTNLFLCYDLDYSFLDYSNKFLQQYSKFIDIHETQISADMFIYMLEEKAVIHEWLYPAISNFKTGENIFYFKGTKCNDVNHYISLCGCTAKEASLLKLKYG